MVCVARVFMRGTEESLQGLLLNHLHIFIIKEQPVVVAFDEAHIMPMVGTTSDMDHDSEEGVLSVYVIGCITELQLHGEYYPV